MLEIFFCNVGDGDAVLLREHREGGAEYTVLVDAGRPYVESREGSLRKDALDYLTARRVNRLDRMILTHPHIDHIGGAARILRAIPTERLEMLLPPPETANRVCRSFVSTKKRPNGLRHMLSILLELRDAAYERGTRVESIHPGEQMLTGALGMTAYMPRVEVIDRQRLVFEALYGGSSVDETLCAEVAEERNLSSLMLRFSYGGRSILLTGDRYAADWEGEGLPPCDILKLPHHGDAKSMTEPLLRRLSPQYAVISCENSPTAKKERPSADVVPMLQRLTPHVLCTENRPMAMLKGSTHNGIRFELEADGRIVCHLE